MTEDMRKRAILCVVCSVGIILNGSGGFLIGLSRGAENIMIKYTGIAFGSYNIMIGFGMVAMSFYTLFKINRDEIRMKCDMTGMH